MHSFSDRDLAISPPDFLRDCTADPVGKADILRVGQNFDLHLERLGNLDGFLNFVFSLVHILSRLR